MIELPAFRMTFQSFFASSTATVQRFDHARRVDNPYLLSATNDTLFHVNMYRVTYQFPSTFDCVFTVFNYVVNSGESTRRNIFSHAVCFFCDVTEKCQEFFTFRLISTFFVYQFPPWTFQSRFFLSISLMLTNSMYFYAFIILSILSRCMFLI